MFLLGQLKKGRSPKHGPFSFKCFNDHQTRSQSLSK